MYYFIFAVCWSLTDHDTVIVKCSNKTDAEIKLRAKYPGAHHFDFCGKTQIDILQ